MNALVSIHDLMPHTMDRVERILDWLKDRDVPPVTLLVVPGRPWEAHQIERLRELADAGHVLAAHGWHHETTPRKFYHRIHAALISRNVAEHLDLDSKGVRELMIRSRNWFGENELPLPDFYVPPAWALGPISKNDLAEVPFKLIETTRGLIHLGRVRDPSQTGSQERHVEDNVPYPVQQGIENGETSSASSTGSDLSRRSGSQAEPPNSTTTTRGRLSADFPTFEKLPLTGYEADTPFREFFLRKWNPSQASAAQRKNLPLRISIHPDDLDLRVADQMDAQIKSVDSFLPYGRR